MGDEMGNPNDTKLRDCFLINEFTAKSLKNMFLIFGRREIDHIEISCPPEKWIKIVYGIVHEAECCEAESE